MSTQRFSTEIWPSAVIQSWQSRLHADRSPSLLQEYHEFVGGDHQVETALVGDDYSAAIPHVLATKDRSIAVEDLFPPSVANGQQVLGDCIAVGK